MKELTDTDSPYAWSEKFQTPIRAMVPSSEQENARRLFYAIDSGSASEQDVEFALDYLEGRPEFVTELNDNAKIESAFTRLIVGRYAAVLKENDEVRRYLRDHVPENCDQWYGSPTVQTEIRKLARSKYLNGGNSAVMKRIDDMTSDEAKDLLKKLVADDVEVGISIITKEGE